MTFMDSGHNKDQSQKMISCNQFLNYTYVLIIAVLNGLWSGLQKVVDKSVVNERLK